jgi:hypothetical protein
MTRTLYKTTLPPAKLIRLHSNHGPSLGRAIAHIGWRRSKLVRVQTSGGRGCGGDLNGTHKQM